MIVFYHLFSEVIYHTFSHTDLRVASLLPVGPQVGDEQQDVIDRTRERVDGRDDVEDEENKENGSDSAVIHGMDLLLKVLCCVFLFMVSIISLKSPAEIKKTMRKLYLRQLSF